ncbi:MAG TPA: hypothetical protein VMN38_04560 [Sphingomicrobium sp.]|nr:hypothetical protein [Sphingomicrobium sp.]
MVHRTRFARTETPLNPLRPRHDGWTAEKQIAFIEALAESGCVEEACRRVGMSDSAAYNLRRRPCGAAFRRAWDAALDYSLSRLEQAALGRALNGVARPVFHRGEQVGEWREYDERLTMFLLRARRPERFGKWIERMLAPGLDDDASESDAAIRLDGGLDGIEGAGDCCIDVDDGEDEGS